MQKKLCKISTIFLSLMLSFSLTNVAFAKDVSTSEPRSITAEPEGIVLEVANQKEYDALVQDIQKGNARAKMKWEEAKAKAKMELSSNKSLLVNSLREGSTSYKSINCTYTLKRDYKIGLILRCDVSSEKRFLTVHDFLVVPQKSSTEVSEVYWDYEFIDSSRTCAVNTSFIVSIKNLQGSYTNYDCTAYVEYYATGKSLLY